MTKRANTKATKTNPLYKDIADQIIAALAQGVRPWEECYSVSRSGFAKRITGEDYKGINRVLLTLAMWEKEYQHPVWMTFNQARKQGGTVRKGEKASLSLFFKPLEVGEEDPESGERTTIPMARRNLVFNVEQIDELSDEFKSKFLPKADEQHTHSPIEKAETFISHVPADTIEADRIPCYIPSKDLVSMPALNRFKTPEQYYATYFHELAHWTKHKSRLNRPAKAGQEGYALEELTAEITASFVCPLVGIEPLIHEEHAPYLEHYITLLNDEPQAFLKACSQAEKAADYLKAYQPDL